MNPSFATAVTPARLLLMEGVKRHGSHATIEALESVGHTVLQNVISPPFSAAVRRLLAALDLIVIDITDSGRDFLPFLPQLNAALGITALRPRVLCYATKHRNPEFVLAVEKCGAQYVRVSDPLLLLEAIDLTLSRTRQLEQHGPSFSIIHRFSQKGTSWCAPGEEVTGVLLIHGQQSFQLGLGLAQRLVFDFLANHRRLAMDAHQIAAGLAGEWFYREHAANSGHKQLKKIRVATVKVLVQRIREALALSFAAANLPFESQDVLRSCPAEGSSRVLYRLCADVRWLHVDAESR